MAAYVPQGIAAQVGNLQNIVNAAPPGVVQQFLPHLYQLVNQLAQVQFQNNQAQHQLIPNLQGQILQLVNQINAAQPLYNAELARNAAAVAVNGALILQNQAHVQEDVRLVGLGLQLENDEREVIRQLREQANRITKLDNLRRASEIRGFLHERNDQLFKAEKHLSEGKWWCLATVVLVGIAIQARSEQTECQQKLRATRAALTQFNAIFDQGPLTDVTLATRAHDLAKRKYVDIRGFGLPKDNDDVQDYYK